MNTRTRQISNLMDSDERVKFALWEENNLYGEDQFDAITDRALLAEKLRED